MIGQCISGFQHALLKVFFPHQCDQCGSSFGEGLSNVLCEPCFDSIKPYQPPVCDRCGVSLPERAFEGAAFLRCSDCDEVVSSLDRVWAFGAYQGALRTAHHAFKFEGMEHLADRLSDRILREVPSAFWKEEQVLVPVPSEEDKERERGYNPAYLLAQALAEKGGNPMASLLRKVRATASQRSLDREHRLKNLKDSFVICVDPMPSRVILVDDVLTTGATLEECAKVLKAAGVHWVGAIVWGRTPRHGSDRPGN